MTSLDELIADSWLPFAGDITIKPLESKVIPEPERDGVTPETCGSCQRPDDTYVWTDEHWRLTGVQPTELPGMVVLQTRDHVDSLVDLLPQLLTALGPMISRLGDIARVHVNRWGDGGAHFHLWFMPRPLGMLQLRGSMLPMWLDLMPTLAPAEAKAPLGRVATTMAEQGGTSHL